MVVFGLTNNKFQVYASNNILNTDVAYYLENNDQVIVLFDDFKSPVRDYEHETKILSRCGVGWIQTELLFIDTSLRDN